MKTNSRYAAAALTALAVASFTGCDQKATTASNERTSNAEASYVAPGEKDE